MCNNFPFVSIFMTVSSGMVGIKVPSIINEPLLWLSKSNSSDLALVPSVPYNFLYTTIKLTLLLEISIVTPNLSKLSDLMFPSLLHLKILKPLI